MPERPDLEYVVPLLQDQVVGRTITAVDVRKTVVMRVAVPGRAQDLLPHRAITAVQRRGHFVLFRLGEGPGGEAPLDMAVHPMLAGRFALKDPTERHYKAEAVCWTLSGVAGGPVEELRYRDDREMGKVYLLRQDDWTKAPGLAKVGIDVLDPKVYTRAAFGKIAAKRRDQAKVFLLDKSALDSFGNAYADETLWAARIHPKAWVRKLDEAQLDALWSATSAVLAEARGIIEERAPPMDEKVRDFLRVRNRKGEPCPRCGDVVRVCGVRGHDAFFCATCQPDVRGSGLVSWRTRR